MEQVNPNTGEVTRASDDSSKVWAALVKAQRAAPAALGKVDYNKFADFDYVAADRMVIAGRAALVEAGLVLVPLASCLGPGHGDAIATLSVTYRLVHETGQWIELELATPVVTKKGTPPDKATFGALTESLGYMYRGLLSIGRLDRDEVRDVSSRDDRDYAPRERDERPREPDDRRDERRDEPPPRESGAGYSEVDRVADGFISQILELKSRGADIDTLRKLEQIPPQVKKAQLPAEHYQRVVKIYNEVVIPMREKLGIAA